MPELCALGPSPADIMIAAEEAAEGERVHARRDKLLQEFAQRQSPADRRMLELMLGGERHHAPYAKILGVTGSPDREQQRIAREAKYRLLRALRRWVLK